MARWIVGTNMPGYMPESDPSEFTNWRDAHSALVAELVRDFDDAGGDANNHPSDAETDISETLGRAKSAPRFSEFGETANGRHYWLTRA